MPGVATLIAGDDIVEDGGGKQETTAQDYLPLVGRPLMRRHHRFIVKQVGRPLETYAAGVELYIAVYDALCGK